ncbi:MAG TPA: tetratricopeptide repeat protein [Chloroflexia bacterium]|nr:tetratricopeptide repeat protein [Chloroflexia bacterium]
MQPAEHSYNLATHFDPTTLRDIPDDPAAMESAIRYLEERLPILDTLSIAQQITTLSRLGSYCRTLGRLDEAQTYLEKAVAISQRENYHTTTLVNRIRLAHVYQWQRRFDIADHIFQDCIAFCRTDLQSYLDFAYQHYGKSLFDQARYAEAVSLFQAALDLRLQKGDTELIESTQLALRAAEERHQADSSALTSASYPRNLGIQQRTASR